MSDSILPPIPGEEQTETNQDELESLLAGLPEASGSSPEPMGEGREFFDPNLVDTSAVPTPEELASCSRVRSVTLEGLQGETPQTACANCQNAVWHHLVQGDLRLYCRVMHVLIDEQLTECDGRFVFLQ